MLIPNQANRVFRRYAEESSAPLPRISARLFSALAFGEDQAPREELLRHGEGVPMLRSPKHRLSARILVHWSGNWNPGVVCLYQIASSHRAVDTHQCFSYQKSNILGFALLELGFHRGMLDDFCHSGSKS